MALDGQLNDIAKIQGGNDPVLYDLSAIDEFRADEAKVPANTFLIVDTTGATYGRVSEDERKGHSREVIGIVPVVTTAANALYAQSYIQLDSVKDVNAFETLGGGVLKTLVAKDANGDILNIDGSEMQNGGLLSSDLVGLIASDSWFSEVKEITVKLLEVNDSV